MPPRCAACEHWTVEPASELLQACEEAPSVDDERQGLEQADMWVLLHRGGDAHQDIASHQGVAVQDHHAFIVRAETGDPPANMPSFTRDVVTPVPVKYLAAVCAPQQREVLRLLIYPDVRIRTIAQDEEVEVRKPAALGDGLIDRLQPRRHSTRRFVIGRDQKRM